MKNYIILVIGPTASGKTDFAQDLAQKENGEILNADSQQFYSGFDIGTGKIPVEQQRVKHHLFDLCAAGEWITAQDFANRADLLIHALWQAQKVPIIVGGTGLYIKALFEGLDELPKRDPKLRAELRQIYLEKGGEFLHQRLRKIDPKSAEKISAQDPSRLIRYLEIYELTGQVPSSLMSCARPESLRYPTHSYWLKPERKILREKIAQRVQDMLDQGWLTEVEKLIQSGLDFAQLSNKPLGYSELAQVLQGSLSLAQAKANIILKTCQYAKRQETFFKKMLAHPAYQNDGSIKIVIAKP